MSSHNEQCHYLEAIVCCSTVSRLYYMLTGGDTSFLQYQKNKANVTTSQFGENILSQDTRCFSSIMRRSIGKRGLRKGFASGHRN